MKTNVGQHISEIHRFSKYFEDFRASSCFFRVSQFVYKNVVILARRRRIRLLGGKEKRMQLRPLAYFEGHRCLLASRVFSRKQRRPRLGH